VNLRQKSIFVMREVASQFERPGLLFSGGKDSIVMFHLARKAFWPAKVPFPLLHIDTGHNFQETLDFRDELAEKYGVQCIVKYVQDSIDQGKVAEETGVTASRNALQTVTLLDAIEDLKLDVALGGGRRDEEKARAKERFFSHRDEFGQWDPKNQRPDCGTFLTGKRKWANTSEYFPLVTGTEMDVWQYIYMEEIEIPNLYFTHKRKVFNRDGVWLFKAPFMQLKENEELVEKDVRCRTIGDITCTGLNFIESRYPRRYY
jgi:sulfate adenylyltransferase subunit 2